jgi:hypothetical protein
VKKIILILILILQTFSQKQSDLLEEAYKSNSLILLDSFFKVWQNEVKPLTINEFEQQNDTIKAVYKLFSLIYNPKNLYKYSGNEYNIDTYYINIKYSLIDDGTIKIRIFDSTKTNLYIDETTFETIGVGKKILYEDSIVNFRPILNIDLQYVYLNQTYKNIFYYYLFGYISNSPRFIYLFSKFSTDEINYRYKFLENFIEIPSPYDNTLYFCTYPAIHAVDFNKEFTKAIVKTKIFDTLWNFYFENIENEWKLINYKFLLYICDG